MEAEGFHLNRLFFFFLAVWSLVGHLDLIMIKEFYFSTFFSLSQKFKGPSWTSHLHFFFKWQR